MEFNISGFHIVDISVFTFLPQLPVMNSSNQWLALVNHSGEMSPLFSFMAVGGQNVHLLLLH